MLINLFFFVIVMVIILLYFTLDFSGQIFLCWLVNLFLLPPLGVDDLPVSRRVMQFHLTPLKCRVSPCMRKAAADQRCDWENFENNKPNTDCKLNQPVILEKNRLYKLKKTGWLILKKNNKLTFRSHFCWGGIPGEDDVCLLTENLRFNLCPARWFPGAAGPTMPSLQS